MANDDRLRLKSHFSVIAHSPDEVELRHGVWNPMSLLLKDDAQSGRLARLVARFDGTVTIAELANEEDVPRKDVEGLVDYLLSLDALEAEPTTALDFYLEQLVPWRSDDGARPTRPILILGDETLTGEIERLLRCCLPDAPVSSMDREDPGIALLEDPDGSWLTDGLLFEERLDAFDPWTDSFLVVALGTIDPVLLRKLNRVCIARDIPWIHAALDGPFVLAGPIVVPGRSPCYECLEMRILMNLRESASYQRYKGALAARTVRIGALPIEPALATLLASHTVLEVMNFALTGSSFTVGKLLAIYVPTMEIAYNDVLRAPSCEACAPLPERDARELYFDMEALIGRNGR
jgi:bacteriocin biosynthesis cyclodehydratase domain-containing protein